MLVFVYLLFAIVSLLTFAHVYKNYRSNLLDKLPGPPTLPLLGNAIILNRSFEDLWTIFRKFLNEYYPTVCLWVFSKPLVFIRHPDDVQILLKSKININKADYVYNHLRKLGNDGLINSGGQKWHGRRKLMNQAFFRSSLGSTAECANKYAELIVKRILYSEDESIQNILLLAMKFSLDIICDASFGYDLHTVGAQYQEEFRKSFEEGIHTIIYRCSWPFLSDSMYKLLPEGRKQPRLRKIIKNFATRILDERRNYHKANGVNLLTDDLIKDVQNKANPEDTEGEYVIPRNTDVFMCFYDLHRDPNFWPEPNKFNPDRFLPEFSKDRHPCAYLPFSLGPRNCIGQKYTLTEVKSLTAHILYNFYLEPIDLTKNVSFEVHANLRPSTDTLRIKFIKILHRN